MKPGSWFVFTFALSAASTPVVAALFEFSGTATHNGQTLYTEGHQVEGNCAQGVFAPSNHEVAYLRPNDATAFASKRLNYDNHPFRPRVEFSQPAFDESLAITYPDDEALRILWQEPAGETREFNVPVEQRLVVDSGFDYFVRANWDRVSNGESIEFQFLAPTRGEHYGFVLEPASAEQIEADITVRIRPTSVVLRFLVDPIVLGYRSDGALTDYLGLTNIRRDADSNHVAHIQYDVTRMPGCELTP
ncbi:hypothetical protein [Marinobacter sp. VGCF2001]|uniref:hypothetical protein n=1 Tax=Marinobacter sp. VGCF2001 TaxID=3417189 RepID=UPI003CF78852